VKPSNFPTVSKYAANSVIMMKIRQQILWVLKLKSIQWGLFTSLYRIDLRNAVHHELIFTSVCYSNDRGKYGLGKILEPPLEDTGVLEHSGTEGEVNGQIRKLCGTLSILTADNLAVPTL